MIPYGTLRPTRFPELAYWRQLSNLWRIVDTETENAIGPHYRTRAELLSTLDRFASQYGCAASKASCDHK